MQRNRSIFLAFIGQEIEQIEATFEIQSGYECWNLKKFTLDNFVETLKSKIPPVNNNVLKNYKRDEGNILDGFGLTEKQFAHCSWGLLIPDSLDDAIANSYAETTYLINLYSPTFLYPLFSGSDFGIMQQQHDKPLLTIAHYQNQSKIFNTGNFVSFFKMMLPQSQYGTWQLDRAQRWDEEDWRLFVASMLFQGLKDYDNSKTSFGWQRESADMGAVLESLFTAGDTQNEEIGYRLRKRIATLLSHRFPSIERDIKELYTQRSAFVHGSFFAQIARDSKTAYNNLPAPDFGLLYKQKECVRWSLVAYLHLAQLVKSQSVSYVGIETTLSLLEKSIIDIELRKKVLTDVETVLSSMPKPKDFDKV